MNGRSADSPRLLARIRVCSLCVFCAKYSFSIAGFMTFAILVYFRYLQRHLSPVIMNDDGIYIWTPSTSELIKSWESGIGNHRRDSLAEAIGRLQEMNL
jgi:hypothetical protein